MNGTQQVARATAVNRAERRLDDMELVINAFATAMVEDRKQTNALIGDLAIGVSKERDERREMTADRDRRIAAWEARTFWQRLLWLVAGR